MDILVTVVMEGLSESKTFTPTLEGGKGVMWLSGRVNFPGSGNSKSKGLG